MAEPLERRLQRDRAKPLEGASERAQVDGETTERHGSRQRRDAVARQGRVHANAAIGPLQFPRLKCINSNEY